MTANFGRAHTAPELKQKRVYNNSIDMWSMGVIVYVSLSGTFPFEENLDINEQIMNPNFMYPPDPWEQVSPKGLPLYSTSMNSTFFIISL